jgi:hypothetical protein
MGMEAGCHFPFGASSNEPFNDAGNIITSKSFQSRVNKLVYYSRNKRIGTETKMKNTIFCLVHSFSRFLAGRLSAMGSYMVGVLIVLFTIPYSTMWSPHPHLRYASNL